MCQVLQLVVGLQREVIQVFLVHTSFSPLLPALPVRHRLCGAFSLNAFHLISLHFKKKHFKNQLGIYNTEELKVLN